MNEEDDEIKAMSKGYNIDIEFYGVAYLDIPVILNGLSIREIKELELQKFKQYRKTQGFKIFEIKSDVAFYIVAGGLIVGTNNWYNENRILNPSLEYDKVLAQA